MALKSSSLTPSCFSMESNNRCAGVISAYFRNSCSTESDLDLFLAVRLLDAGSAADVIDAGMDGTDITFLLNGGAANAVPAIESQRCNCFRTLPMRSKNDHPAALSLWDKIAG